MNVGLDVGRSGIKATSGSLTVYGLPVVAKMPPSHAGGAELDRCVRNDGHLYLEALQLEYRGDAWLVGERVEALGLLGQYPMTVCKADPTTRILVLAALAALGTTDQADICIGLPLHRIEQEGARLRDLLRGKHPIRTAGQRRTLSIRGVVVPEGLGLWVRSLFSVPDQLPDLGLVRMPTVVLDFGHRTVQGCVLVRMNLTRRPYVSAHGMYEVWEGALMDVLEGAGQTVYEAPQRAAMMARLLRRGELTVRGVTVTLESLHPALMTHAERLWPRISAELARMLEQVPYERVVAGGGGIHLFGDLVRQQFGSGVILIEDRFAQAEGYRLFLEHREWFGGVR